MELILNDKERLMGGHGYVEWPSLIIPKIAKKENAAVIGTGVQYVLHNLVDTCHMRLTAKEKGRIKIIDDNLPCFKGRNNPDFKKNGQKTGLSLTSLRQKEPC